MESSAGKQNRWYFDSSTLSNTPSFRAGISADKELSYRQQAANLIQDMGQRLNLSQLSINTAIVYMHRFYVFHSFHKFKWAHIAVCALFLAAKVEEQPRKMEYVINVAHMCLHGKQNQLSKTQIADESGRLIKNENIMLQTLGFDIAIEHPHTFVVKTCELVRATKDLAQTCYFMATQTLHLTTLCLQHRPTVVACVCIHLACKWSNWEIPKSTEGKDWFLYVDPLVTIQKLEELTQQFLDILEKCPSRLKKKVMSGGQQSSETSNSGDPSSSKRPEGPSSSSSSKSHTLAAPSTSADVRNKNQPGSSASWSNPVAPSLLPAQLRHERRLDGTARVPVSSIKPEAGQPPASTVSSSHTEIRTEPSSSSWSQLSPFQVPSSSSISRHSRNIVHPLHSNNSSSSTAQPAANPVKVEAQPPPKPTSFLAYKEKKEQERKIQEAKDAERKEKEKKEMERVKLLEEERRKDLERQRLQEEERRKEQERLKALEEERRKEQQKEQERIRLEAERKAAEEAERLRQEEQERLQQEESNRIAQEALRRMEEEERKAEEERQQQLLQQEIQQQLQQRPPLPPLPPPQQPPPPAPVALNTISRSTVSMNPPASFVSSNDVSFLKTENKSKTSDDNDHHRERHHKSEKKKKKHKNKDKDRHKDRDHHKSHKKDKERDKERHRSHSSSHSSNTTSSHPSSSSFSHHRRESSSPSSLPASNHDSSSLKLKIPMAKISTVEPTKLKIVINKDRLTTPSSPSTSDSHGTSSQSSSSRKRKGSFDSQSSSQNKKPVV